MSEQKVQIPLTVMDEVKPNTPLNYNNLCRLVGELYMESWTRIKSIQDDANNLTTQFKNLVEDLRVENATLKERLKLLENKNSG